MDLATVIGLIGAILSMIIGSLLEANEHLQTATIQTFAFLGPLARFIQVPAFVIIFGGTFFATMIGVGMRDILTIPKYLRIAMGGGRKTSVHEDIGQIVSFAEKSRREGLLSLEDDVREMEPGIRRHVLEMIIDGTDPTTVTNCMETELAEMEHRHKKGFDLFNAAGGYSPTMGIIGTVMGVVAVLAKLGDNPDTSMNELAGGVALAFIATFYGISFANLVLLPLAGKLKFRSEEEISYLRLLFEGYQALQGGDNPRVIERRLIAFLESGARTLSEPGQK